MGEIDAVVSAIRGGALAVLPTDTVYGLVCTAFDQQAAVDLYRLKGRREIQPTAIIAASVEVILELLPELDRRDVAIVRALLPGPFTLVVPNPERRFPWLSGSRPESIGIRVPVLVGPTAEIVAGLRAVVATSANLPGGSDPCRLEDVPERIRSGAVVILDGGELPGTPSTVIDLTGAEPVVVRSGAGAAKAALALIAATHIESLPSRDPSLMDDA